MIDGGRKQRGAGLLMRVGHKQSLQLLAFVRFWMIELTALSCRKHPIHDGLVVSR